MTITFPPTAFWAATPSAYAAPTASRAYATPAFDASPLSADTAELTPWEFHPRVALSAHLSEVGAAVRAEAELEEFAAQVEAVTALAQPTGDQVDAVLDVARHLARTSARVAALEESGMDPIGELRRVVAGYDHHLRHHRYVLGAAVGLADLLLWRAIIALPVRLGEDAAAQVLRDLDGVRRWAVRLAAAEPAAVALVGEAIVVDQQRRRRAA